MNGAAERKATQTRPGPGAGPGSAGGETASDKGKRKVSSRKTVRIGGPRVGAYLCVALLMFLFLLPLAYLLNTALKSPEEFISNPVGLVRAPNWENFPVAWEMGQFGRYFVNTVIYTLAGAGLGTVIAVLMGFPVARGYIRGGKLWNGLFVFVMFLPNALMTQFHLLIRLHLYNTQLGYILMLSVGVGVGPLLFRGFVLSLPRELDEAAAVDGVGYWRYLLTFVLPLARPALATVFILQAVWIWNEIIMATILLSDAAKWPIATGLNAFKGLYSNNWALLSAATLIVAAPLMVGYVFIQRYLVSGVVGAVKG